MTAAPSTWRLELSVADLDRLLDADLGEFGFRCHVRRREETFAYLVLGGVHLVLEQDTGPADASRAVPLEHPFGRREDF